MVRCAIVVLCLFPALAFAQATPAPGVQDVMPADEPAHAAEVAREGQLLPQTFSPTIGHKQVIGVFTGGYD